MGGRNRIVVDYGDIEDLVLLAVIDTETGEEDSYEEMVKSYSNDFTVVKRYNEISNDVRELHDLEEDNREGFVVKYSNGFRLKVKFKEYVRLHRIVTNVSTKIIWEFLKDGKPLNELLEKVPDEFDAWVSNNVALLHEKFQNIKIRETLRFELIMELLNDKTSKKEFAAHAMKHNTSSILFKMYDGKPYDNIIWKMIEPEFAKPFANEVDL